MTTAEQAFDIIKTTLGGALHNGPLTIPPYQREYAWKPERVRKLFADIGNAMGKGRASYFLGTLMFTPGRPPSVIDGQQRLATTMIFLAAVRDAFIELGAHKDVKSIQDDYLMTYDRAQKEDVPRLTLNMDDREYIFARVLTPPNERKELPEPKLHSHRLIDLAARAAAERVAHIIKSADTKSRRVDELNRWVDFIADKAIVVVLQPPNRATAFQMYVTLNDRAQRTTQADMIKSHLFEQAEDRINDAQSKWSSMRGTIEELGPAGADDPLLVYLHHVSIGLYGHLLADDIFEVMEDKVGGRNNALKFLDALSRLASDYAAIQTPTHAKWASYDQRVKAHITDIREIRMSFIRPLMLAVAARFTPRETVTAFRAFLSWVVRFLISGGSRSQVVAITLGNAANAVMEKRIKTAKELFAVVAKVIPTDPKFHSAFCNKSLASSRQVRFILRELESQARSGSADALLGPVIDTSVLTLEHILPKNPEAKGWSHFTAEEKRTFANKIGNLALLNAKDNGAIGDKPFDEKLPVIEKSKNIKLTGEVLTCAGAGAKWTIDAIRKRQRILADLALEKWPINPT
jgi:hypothetical protein